MKLIEKSDFDGIPICRLLSTDSAKLFIKMKCFPTISNIDYLEILKHNRLTSILKSQGLYKQTGARSSKQTFLDEEIFSFLKVTSNAESYSKMIMSIPIDNILDLVYSGFEKDNNENVKGEKIYLEYFNSLLNGIVTVKHQYPVLGYRLDVFIPELNIAIEYDEKQHNTSHNYERDLKRENKIKSHLGCDFFRIDERYDIIDQIEKIASIIIKIKTGICPDINGKFITERFQDLLIPFIIDFDLYFRLRNIICIGKENLISLSYEDRRKIEALESNLAFAINMGYIKTFESLIEELRKMYNKKLNT